MFANDNSRTPGEVLVALEYVLRHVRKIGPLNISLMGNLQQAASMYSPDFTHSLPNEMDTLYYNVNQQRYSLSSNDRYIQKLQHEIKSCKSDADHWKTFSEELQRVHAEEIEQLKNQQVVQKKKGIVDIISYFYTQKR